MRVTDIFSEQNGVITHGVIKEKRAAAAEFEEARKQGKTAGHVRTRYMQVYTGFIWCRLIADRDKRIFLKYRSTWLRIQKLTLILHIKR
jgi:hypothetical protein